MLKELNAILDNISLSKKGLVVVSIPLLVLVFTLTLMAWHEGVSRDAQARIRHSLQVKASIYQVLALLTDSETAVRGYLLWGDPVYLDPYNQARTQLSPALAQLSELVQNNSAQSSSTKQLRQKAFVKLDTLRYMLNNPPSTSTSNNTMTRQSLQSMVEIRAILEGMKHTEEALLDSRIRDYDELLGRLNISLIGLFLLAILCGLTASYIVSASILQRVNNLETYARRVSRGQEAEWEDTGEDELGLLGRSVGVMTHNLLAREETLHQTRAQLEKANASLERQLKETRAANQELETFSYSVSHDLRAPLRHVAGFSELMLKNSENLDDQNKRYLNIIASSVGQMGVLIDELLAFSRMGRTSLKKDIVDLNDVIREVLSDLGPEIVKSNIVWKISELTSVRGDRLMIRLVFQNLISNAIKYSRDRDPAVIEIYDAEDTNPTMRSITVSDNGVGFDMKHEEKLFGVFQRLHSSEDYEGTGIGLATVRRIVKRHGGIVSAKSSPGHGADFTFTLPANETEQIEQRQQT